MTLVLYLLILLLLAFFLALRLSYLSPSPNLN